MDPNKIIGNGPFKPDPAKEPSKKIDEEKFKKVLEIGASGESKERRKRNLKKEEEEGEEEDKLKDQDTPAPTGFSDYMDGKDEKGSIFDSQSKGTIRRPSTQPKADQAPSPYKVPQKKFPQTNQETEGEKPSLSPSPIEEVGPQAPPSLEENEIPPKDTNPSHSQTVDSYSSSTFLEPDYQLPEEQKEHADTSLLKDQPKKNALKKKKKMTSKEKKLLSEEESLNIEQIKTKTPEKAVALKKEKKKDELAPPLKKEKKKDELAPALEKDQKKTQLAPALEKDQKKTQLGPALEKDQKKTQLAPAPEKDKKKTQLAPAPKKDKKKTQRAPAPEKDKKKTQLAPAPEKDKKKTQRAPNQADTHKQIQISKQSNQEDSLSTESERKKGTLTLPDESIKKPSQKEPVSPKTSTFDKLHPKKARTRKKEKTLPSLENSQVEGLVPSPNEVKRSEVKEKHESKETDFPEATSSTASIPLPSPEASASPTPPSDAPVYTKLSSEMYELLETVSGVILIEKNESKTSTIVTLNMPNTVFNGSKLVLDQYSTAPMIYNIQLLGSPEAVKVFAENLSSLSQSFEAMQYNFEVKLLQPILITKSQKHLIRRKSGLGDKEEKKDEQEQK